MQKMRKAFFVAALLVAFPVAGGLLAGCDPVGVQSTLQTVVDKAKEDRQWFRKRLCSDRLGWKQLRLLIRSEMSQFGIDSSGYCEAVLGQQTAARGRE